MRIIINWILLLLIALFVISLIANLGVEGFNVTHLMMIACIGGLTFLLFNRICDDRGPRRAFGINETIKEQTPQMPITKSNLICPNNAREAVGFLAGVVITINYLMPYAQNSKSAKIQLCIWQNDDRKTATLKFWYDKDDSTMKDTLLTHYNLEDKFHFTDDGWINYDSKQIVNFSPKWVNESNAEQVIADTFLNRCTYARILDSSCNLVDGKLSCFITFGF